MAKRGCSTAEQRAHLADVMRRWHRERREYAISKRMSVLARTANRGFLVPHAKGKCQACGGTLVTDPLPHQCNPTERAQSRAIPDGDIRPGTAW